MLPGHLPWAMHLHVLYAVHTATPAHVYYVSPYFSDEETEAARQRGIYSRLNSCDCSPRQSGSGT